MNEQVEISTQIPIIRYGFSYIKDANLPDFLKNFLLYISAELSGSLPLTISNTEHVIQAKDFFKNYFPENIIRPRDTEFTQEIESSP